MKNDLIYIGDKIFRVLEFRKENSLIIDCRKPTMPVWINTDTIIEAKRAEEKDLGIIPPFEDLTPNQRSVSLRRYTLISPILHIIADISKRNAMICEISEQQKISKQTLRSYLCKYLVYQNVAVLAPKDYAENEDLSPDRKNMRWALNKYFYTRNKNSLKTAYALMIKNKYCDENSEISDSYPSFDQFRYFYRKTRKMENYYISRNGLTNYQRNNRPLTGDGIQEYAPTIGTAMLDSTICDIYLLDPQSRTVNRPILTAAIDANTSFCVGYALTWEGGTDSLKKLLQNMITNKEAFCRNYGIEITAKQWNSDKLPGKMVTDGGGEYIGQNFEQIAELGIVIDNLPPHRPELKGVVEKFFDLVQGSYKNSLVGRGVVVPDYHELSGVDYRDEACLSLEDFEKIIIRCIVFYNNSRLLEKYPFTAEMLSDRVKPHAADIWNYKMKTEQNCLISVSKADLTMVLLPRTTGKFTRSGLIVNKLRYYADGFKENYLNGGTCIVAYDPDNCDKVWIRDKSGRYTVFKLIESRFKSKSLPEAVLILDKQKKLIDEEEEANLKAKIDLIKNIENITNTSINERKTK